MPGAFCSRRRFQRTKPVRMSSPATPSNPNRAGDDRNLVPVDETTAITFEDKLHVFWKKNRTAVLALCVLVVVGILGKGGWDYLAGKKELDVEKAYATATSSDQLKAFAAAHPNHTLGGIAQLRLADEAYTAGKSADAIAGYDKVIAVLKTGPLAARAQVGRALAKIQAGKGAEGATDLKQLANDASQLKAIRSEAAYHLMSLAVEGGNAAEAQKLSDQLMQIDPSSSWTQRSLALRATLPVQAEKHASTEAAPGADPKAEKKSDAGSSMEVKLPTTKK